MKHVHLWEILCNKSRHIGRTAKAAHGTYSAPWPDKLIIKLFCPPEHIFAKIFIAVQTYVNQKLYITGGCGALYVGYNPYGFFPYFGEEKVSPVHQANPSFDAW